MRKWIKIGLIAISIALGVILIIEGVKLEDIAEIITNGTTLCLSCIGIG
ncbi:hypothetical protein J7L68_04565 [bacterium]|nr:hypothetical protein [bacterium]